MQIFPRSSNAIARASLVIVAVVVASLGGVLWELERTPYITNAGVRKAQPVPFSHQHHVTEKYLRPREHVFNRRYEPPANNPLHVNDVVFNGKPYNDQIELGNAIKDSYKVRSVRDITSCNACHR